MTYVAPDVVSDETTAIEAILAYIAGRIPGWVPADDSVETILAEAVGIAIATADASLMARTLDAYAGFGQNILSISRNQALPATCTSTWTLTGSDGLVIPAGTEVDLTQPDGTIVPFAVATEVTIAAGVMVETGVPLVAQDAGAATSGATNPAAQDELVGVSSITVDTPSANGSDDETDDDYVNRLVKAAKRIHSIPITAADFADATTDVPGVARCAVINLLDPSEPDDVTTGHITLYPVGEDGLAVSDDVKTAIAAMFAAIESPLNVTVHIEDPSYVTFPVTAALTAEADADQAALQAAAVAAIEALIDPASFDADEDADGGWADPRSTGVTIYDVAAALDDLPGLKAITSITVNSTTSKAFTDPVTLPQLSAAPTVTVS